ncbi:ATP-binding protein [Herbiconiux moechotypicola]|uniref:AAA family ATPase n=1 Tax=Herbiconiux moechotypicola TaxID=637393 RepID=A0ABP5QDC0_9MICO|nr:ATP-binding protein [Herbiconiux moechotypicola]MCS5729794.1 ATP-binding protein [Herbiconiux moechotypicola]
MVVILVDGPSGSGKTELAQRIAGGWAGADVPQVVHLDDIYPGWGGLEKASRHIVDELLGPLRSGGVPRWRRYDWAGARLAEWHELDPGLPVLIEGCGALSRDAAMLADLAIWVETGDAERKRRALERDGELYASHWDEWEQQWQGFCRRERPRESATVIVPT